MREEISDSDDYVDWLQWVLDVDKGKQINRQVAQCVKAPALLQIHQVGDDKAQPEQLTSSSSCLKSDTRWEEISQKIRIDHKLGKEQKQQLWGMLGHYQDVFTWNKGELGCCTVGEHSIDT